MIKLGKLRIEGLVAVLVLEGTQDGIVRVGLGGSHKGFQGTGCQPGILVEEVNVVIAVVQGVLKAHIVGLGKAHVLRAAHQVRPGEVLRHIIRTPVRGIVVPHIQVRGKLTRICPWTGSFGRLRGKLTRICPWVHGAETPLQPGRAVIGNNYDKDACHGLKRIKISLGVCLENTACITLRADFLFTSRRRMLFLTYLASSTLQIKHLSHSGSP